MSILVSWFDWIYCFFGKEVNVDYNFVLSAAHQKTKGNK
jgi:hypothetical protein